MTPKKSNNPKLRESEIQSHIVEFLSYHARKNHYLFFSVPNEHDLSASGNRYARMATLKKMGFTPGAPDLVIVKKGYAFMLEVKSATGRISDNQRRFMSWAGETDTHYVVVNSYDQAVAVLIQWGVVETAAK